MVVGDHNPVSRILSIMRFAVVLTLPLALAACAPSVPESGVGFQDYDSYVRNRDANAGLAQPIGPTGFSTDSIGAAIDRSGGGMGGTSRPATAAVIGAAPSAMATTPGIRPRGNAPAGILEQSGEMVHSSTGISDENDFNAVSGRETIASDKQRIEQNRAQYEVIQPGALPVRPGGLAPNIVDYALATRNPVGVQLYRRSSFSLGNPASKCAGYASPDLAQEAFLERGGPERDRLGLDPDGDGYACGWDPSPFRIR
jgi:hypothetical protein